MLGILLDYLLKGNRLRDTLVRLGFWSFNGVLAGILLNDVLRLLYGDFEDKSSVNYGVAAAIAAAPFVYDKFALLGAKTNNIALGAGMMTGSYWATRTENKKSLEVKLNK